MDQAAVFSQRYEDVHFLRLRVDHARRACVPCCQGVYLVLCQFDHLVFPCDYCILGPAK